MIESIVAKVLLFAGAILAIFKAGKYKSDAVNADKRAKEREQMAIREIEINRNAAQQKIEVQEEIANVKNSVDKLADGSAAEQLRKFWTRK